MVIVRDCGRKRWLIGQNEAYKQRFLFYRLIKSPRDCTPHSMAKAIKMGQNWLLNGLLHQISFKFWQTDTIFEISVSNCVRKDAGSKTIKQKVKKVTLVASNILACSGSSLLNFITCLRVSNHAPNFSAIRSDAFEIQNRGISARTQVCTCRCTPFIYSMYSCSVLVQMYPPPDVPHVFIANWSLNAQQIWLQSVEPFLSYSLASGQFWHPSRGTCHLPERTPSPKWSN